MKPSRYTTEQARVMARGLGLGEDPDTVEQLRVGMESEHEHEDVTKGDAVLTARIAAAHLREDPLYYLPLLAIERFRDGETQAPVVDVNIVRAGDGVRLVLNVQGVNKALLGPVMNQTASPGAAMLLRENPALATVYAWMLLTSGRS